MKAWKWLSVAVLVLAACGKEEEKGVNLTTANSRTENAQPTATALADTDGLNGTLMVVKGNALYYLADEPVKIAEGFDSEAAAFTLSPDRQTLLYVLPGHNDSEFGADLSLMRWDAQTQVSQEIMPLDSTRWQVQEWSPDGNIAAVRTLNYFWMVRLDTNKAYQYEQASYSEVSWLKDGSALLLDLRTKQTGGGETFFEIEAVIHFDPVTGEFTPVEGLDLEALSEDPSQLMAALEAQGWEAVTDTHLSGVQIVPPDSYYGTAPESCATWEIADVTTDENGVRTLDPVYTVDGVFQLTDLTNLTNESKLFLQWTMPDCRLNMPTIALVKLMPDGEAKVLAEGVFPGLRIGRDRSFVDALVSNRVSVSPDQRYAAWIGGSLDTGTSTLNVIDLETGENRVIQQEAGTGSGSGFVETQVITAVYWMGE